ncbi:MAG: DUF1653 domain-containing protein [Candidatus Saccharimonadales bacterium]
MRHKDTEPQIEPGRYRHYKGGEYEVTGEVALDSEYEDRWLVLYRKAGETSLNAHPYEMFFEEVPIDNQSIPRFKKIDDERQA